MFGQLCDGALLRSADRTSIAPACGPHLIHSHICCASRNKLSLLSSTACFRYQKTIFRIISGRASCNTLSLLSFRAYCFQCAKHPAARSRTFFYLRLVAAVPLLNYSLAGRTTEILVLPTKLWITVGQRTSMQSCSGCSQPHLILQTQYFISLQVEHKLTSHNSYLTHFLSQYFVR